MLLSKRQGFADGKDLITIIQQKDCVPQAPAEHPRAAVQRKGAGHTALQPAARLCHAPASRWHSRVPAGEPCIEQHIHGNTQSLLSTR